MNDTLKGALAFSTALVSFGGPALAQVGYGYTPPSGSVSAVTATNGLNSRTLAAWMGDAVNVLGQNVTGNGSTNDQPALLTAGALAQSTGEMLFLPALNASGAAAVYNLSTNWLPASGDLSMFIAPGATFSGAGVPTMDNQISYYGSTLFSPMLNARTFGSYYSGYTGVFLNANIATNNGAGNTIAVFGEGIAQTNNSPVWGANFICVPLAVGGKPCNAEEVDTVVTVNGALAYGLLLTAQGGYNSQTALTIDGTAPGVQWTNGINFAADGTGASSFINSLIQTAAFTGSVGHGMYMRGSYSAFEMSWPSLLVGPTPATPTSRLEVLGGNNGGNVTLAVVPNDGGSSTLAGMIVEALGTGDVLIENSGGGIIAQFHDITASSTSYAEITAGSGVMTYGAQGANPTSVSLAANGTGSITLTNTTGGAMAQFAAAASTVSRLQVTGAVASAPVLLGVGGTATNLELQVPSANSVIAATTNGYAAIFTAPTASTVNYWNFAGSATGVSVQATVQGTDTNVNGLLAAQGSGAWTLQNGNGAMAQFTAGASTVSRFQFTAAAAGAAVILGTGGTATNIAINAGASNFVQFLGAGSWSANGTTAVTLTALGPAGASTTVAKWLTIVDNTGATHYIPAY